MVAPHLLLFLASLLGLTFFFKKIYNTFFLYFFNIVYTPLHWFAVILIAPNFRIMENPPTKKAYHPMIKCLVLSIRSEREREKRKNPP
jgi:hypothetical protein